MKKAIKRYIRAVKGEYDILSVGDFDFILKPLTSNCVIDKDTIKDRIKELQKSGKTQDEISTAIAPEIISKITNLPQEEQLIYFLKKYVVYPQITEDKQKYEKDELPFSIISKKIKDKLVSRMIKTSALFNYGVARG